MTTRVLSNRCGSNDLCSYRFNVSRASPHLTSGGHNIINERTYKASWYKCTKIEGQRLCSCISPVPIYVSVFSFPGLRFHNFASRGRRLEMFSPPRGVWIGVRPFRRRPQQLDWIYGDCPLLSERNEAERPELILRDVNYWCFVAGCVVAKRPSPERLTINIIVIGSRAGTASTQHTFYFNLLILTFRIGRSAKTSIIEITA